MTLRVDVWSDFVCPWCFLASSSLEKLIESHRVDVVWHAYELRPKGAPPLPEAYLKGIEAKRPVMQQMAREVYGLEINEGPFGISSRAALIGSKYAESVGLGAAYHDAVFRAYWQQARSIDETGVLVEIAAGVGLNGEQFETALSDLEFEKQVISDVVQAQALGLTGVPALIFERKYLVSGAQPHHVLAQVVEQVRGLNGG